jgi:hypothetical protein
MGHICITNTTSRPRTAESPQRNTLCSPNPDPTAADPLAVAMLCVCEIVTEVHRHLEPLTMPPKLLS